MTNDAILASTAGIIVFIFVVGNTITNHLREIEDKLDELLRRSK